MKKLVLVTMVAVLGFMFLIPSLGFCDNPWRRDNHRPQYVVVREHGPRYRHPVPVHYNYHQRNVYVERHDHDRGGQVAVAALGGIVVGTLLGTVIAQGR
ncbi:MAG: hypothetical protein PHT96_09330 [Syntrophorhabdaceae bacterium]|nr:hypothetical protein [Syntrophorhabdaceae bacterium]MDD4196595.1 hypothetical protein [Syntrophorhabdaceae bacterium]